MRYILALILILILGLLAALALSTDTTPVLAQPFLTQQATPVFVTPGPSPTPTLALTPPPTSAAPGCAAAFEIPIGSVVTVRSGVNIRVRPSVSAPWLANYQEFRNFTVLEGPVCSENYFWWRITGHGVTGWVAQENLAMDFITSVQPPPGVFIECADPLDLSVGEEIDLLVGVRIRQDPGLEGLVLTVAPHDSTPVVLSDTPRCVNGYNWWLVRVEVVNFVYDGWMAEGSRDTPDELFIDTSIDNPCYPPRSLAIGERVRVWYRDHTPKNLRIAPNHYADILYVLVKNVPMEIIGGPVCSGGMNWWQVRVLASTPVTGWMGEGARGNYWIRPIVYDTGR